MSDSFRVLDRHMLSLHLSGIYFTFEELLGISKALDLSLAATSKEGLIKSLVEESIKSEKIYNLKNELQKVAQKREESYNKAQEISGCKNIDVWKQKLNSFRDFLENLE